MCLKASQGGNVDQPVLAAGAPCPAAAEVKASSALFCRPRTSSKFAIAATMMQAATAARNTFMIHLGSLSGAPLPLGAPLPFPRIAKARPRAAPRAGSPTLPDPAQPADARTAPGPRHGNPAPVGAGRPDQCR